MLKKIRNFPITALVRTTYEKLNKYCVDRETQADAMIASGQVYTLIAAQFIIEEETKSNTHLFNSLTAKDFNFKLRKEWIRERSIEWGNSVSGWIKEPVIVGNFKSYTCHVHMSLLHVHTCNMLVQCTHWITCQVSTKSY